MTDSIAACDIHLAELMMLLVTDGEWSFDVRVTKLSKKDDHFKCKCHAFATWYIRRVDESRHMCSGRSEGWVPFGTHVEHPMPLDFRNHDEAGMPGEERVTP